MRATEKCADQLERIKQGLTYLDTWDYEGELDDMAWLVLDVAARTMDELVRAAQALSHPDHHT